jgi:hypothetical protein
MVQKFSIPILELKQGDIQLQKEGKEDKNLCRSIKTVIAGY